MFQNIAKALIVLMIAAGCSSTDKKVDADTTASNVSTQDLNFDSRGSDSGQINGLTTVNFEYDKSTLTPSTRSQLDQNAEWIKANSQVTIQIEGHCDARGSIEYNLALGERRARAVKSYLVSKGIDSSRLSVISYGKEKLLDMSDSESAHSTNRRANFVPLAN